MELLFREGVLKFFHFYVVGMTAWKIYGFAFKQSPIFPPIKLTQLTYRMSIPNDFTSVNICHQNPINILTAIVKKW
jgi:hypothetical protein